jgi:hypothetical protein
MTMDFDRIYENYFLDTIDIWEDWDKDAVEQCFVDENIKYTDEELNEFTDYLKDTLEEERRIAKDEYIGDFRCALDNIIEETEHLNDIDIASVLVEYANTYLSQTYY